MKIGDLKDKTKVDFMEVKIIWDQAQPREMFGKTIKTVIVVDKDNQESKPSALLDLYNEQIEQFKQFDKLMIFDCFAKLVLNGKGQFRLVNNTKVQKIEAA